MQLFCFSEIEILYLPVLFLPQVFSILFKHFLKQNFFMLKVFHLKTTMEQNSKVTLKFISKKLNITLAR